jgi:DNA polymerase
MRLHLDFETRCEVDLKKVGLRRYVTDPSFKIILTAWAVAGEEVEVYEGFPGRLPWFSTLHAFNAPFELACLARYGVYVPPSKVRCTMAHAYGRGFSGGLADVGEQVGIPEELRKMKEGARLITKFCKPRRPSAKNPDRFWTKETAPAAWSLFMDYNSNDVEAERAIWRVLNDEAPWTPEEQATWELDREINDRGLPVDVALAATAIRVAAAEKREIEAKCKQITGGISPSQVGALLAWCQERGYTGDDLGAETIQTFLKSCA